MGQLVARRLLRRSGLGLAGLCFVAIHYTAGSSWSVAIRRVPEALAGNASAALAAVAPRSWWDPAAAVSWTSRLRSFEAASRPGAGIQAGSGCPARSFSCVRPRTCDDLDRCSRWRSAALHAGRTATAIRDGPAPTSGCRPRFSMVFGVTFTLASFDWVMSLEPLWFSTIFGVYNFAGLFLSGLAAIVVVALWLERAGPLRNVLTDDHLHDLGKLLFAFSVFWMYIWFSPVHADLVHQHPGGNGVLRAAGAWRLVRAVSRQHRPQLVGPVRGAAAPRREAPSSDAGRWRRSCWWVGGWTST